MFFLRKCSFLHAITMHFLTTIYPNKCGCWLNIITPKWPRLLLSLRCLFTSAISLAWWTKSIREVFVFFVRILCFSHGTPHVTPCSHPSGQLSFCVCVPDYIPALCPTSSPPVMWAAVSSWASAPESEIRVRLRSVPLPPLLMLQARERAAGSPAATQIQPATARTQAPGRQPATVCHFNPHAPTGLLEREQRGEGRKEVTERGKKRAPTGRGISLWREHWSMLLKAFLLLAGCLLLALTGQIMAGWQNL